MTEESLFVAALEKKSPAERQAFLDGACGADAALRARVQMLLDADARARGILDRQGPGEPQSTVISAPGEQPGTLIAGRYKLLQPIGEGGMGTVWMADQTEPIKRRVAVKLIRVDRGHSQTILARFEAERQAIALMDHPHIAKLLDAGTTDTGQPYFIMELVKGVPLTEFCDTHRLSVQHRLDLFQQICSAVQHAHQKGIIHRDLKPTNILVESHDGKPVPKVIDFGLAKATSGLRLTEHTMFTAFGSVMGTPLYMAPEQAQFNAVDIDTRADVYALGVILYELLTGTTPLTRDTLKKAALDEMLKLVREQEALTPSSRLSSADSLPSVAANRQSEPAKLGRFVKGELDWIVLKALSKERDRRYETANGFAKDIERFMNHEPVQAGPVTAAYRIKKFVRRNRGQVIAAGLVLFALLAGMAGTTIGLLEAKKQERLAKAAEQAEADRAKGERLAKLDAQAQKTIAEQAAAQEKAANVQAQKRLAQIEKANDILGSIFENLDPAEIAKAERPLQAILVEKLDNAVAQLEGESIGDPLVVAAMQNKLGHSLLGLGEPDKAIVLLEKARATFQATLGPEHPNALDSMNNLARAYQAAGKLDLALMLFEETLKLTKAKFGPEQLETLASMNNLASAYRAAGKLDLALPLFEESLNLTKAKLGPEHPDTLTGINNLALAYQAAGKLDLALPLLDETLKLTKATLGPEHPNTLGCMNNLAQAYQAARKVDLALPLLEATLQLMKAKLGPEHPDTLTSMNNLALAYQAAGKVDLALPLLDETLKLTKAMLGPDHPNTLGCMNNLAQAFQDAGKLDLALPLMDETLKLTKAMLGPDHPNTLGCMNNLASAYQAVGKLDLALPLFEESLKLMKAKLGTEHPTTLISMNNLAAAYRAAMKPDLALPLYEETLKLRKAKLGPEHPNTLMSLNNLATAYQAAGKLDLAVPLFEESLKLWKAKFGPEHPHTLASMGNLGKAYCAANQGEKAASALKEFVAGERKRSKPDDLQFFAGLLALVAVDLSRCGQHAVAEELLRECLVIREKTQPDDWRAFNTKSLLGGAFLGQNKYADAEPLLLAGYEGMKQREKTIPEQGKVWLTKAIERLVQLYEATDKRDEVAKWQKELDAIKAAVKNP